MSERTQTGILHDAADGARHRIAIIGFGEVGPIFADAWRDRADVTVFDIKLQDSATREAMVSRIAKTGARVCDSVAAAVDGARYVLSAVTASQAGAVAVEAARSMRAGQLFLDLNSVSPRVKQGNRDALAQCGADYVEAAVMAPVPPQGIRVPMLLGGARAEEASAFCNTLGMKTETIADEIGLASAVKLCRSIMIKGNEALCVQSMLAASHFGVDARVLKSLAATFPGVGWDDGYEGYLIGRVVEHGQRRSEEMREAAAMLQEMDMDPALANAIADVQQRIAALGKTLLADLDKKGALPGWRDQRRALGAA
ncbi:DUF1932 domain-containing protein [Robbsia sp. KACC 23696]|uniref:NAD(P)-dependent oxidoreductase n=1 Tax=Robbsia sp. KACC 23696 TaxID=3149231 RepID=UPI00325B4B52